MAQGRARVRDPVLELEARPHECFEKRTTDSDGDEVIRDGKPIPVDWDPNGVGEY